MKAPVSLRSEPEALVRSSAAHDRYRLSTAPTLVTLVTACPDPSARSFHHTACPTLTISRVPCLTPA